MVTEELHNSLKKILQGMGYTGEMVDEQVQAIYEMTFLYTLRDINSDTGKQLSGAEIIKYISENEKVFVQKFEGASIKVMKEYFSFIK